MAGPSQKLDKSLRELMKDDAVEGQGTQRMDRDVLEKHVERLNSSGGLNSPLDAAKILEAAANAPACQIEKLLKVLEERTHTSDPVKNPTAWVTSALRKRKSPTRTGSDGGASGSHVGEDKYRGGGGGRGVASTGSDCKRGKPFTAFGGSRNVASPLRSAPDNSLPEQSRKRRRSRSMRRRRNSSSHSHPRAQVCTHTRSDARQHDGSQCLALQPMTKCPFANSPKGCQYIRTLGCTHLHLEEDLTDPAKDKINDMSYDPRIKTMREVRRLFGHLGPEEFKLRASDYIIAGSTRTDTQGTLGPSAEASRIPPSPADQAGASKPNELRSDLEAEKREEKERETMRDVFGDYLRSLLSEAEGSSEEFDEVEKNKVIDAVKDGQSWLKSNPKADVHEVAQKEEEVRAICAPIISKYGGGGALCESREDAGGIDDVAEEERTAGSKASPRLDQACGQVPLPTELQDPAELSDSSLGKSAPSDPYQMPLGQAEQVANGQEADNITTSTPVSSTPFLIAKKEEPDDARQMRVAQFHDQSIKELPIYEEVKKKLCNNGHTSYNYLPRSAVLAQELVGRFYEPLSRNWIDAQRILDHLIKIEWCDNNFVILDHEDDGDQCQMAPEV